MAPYCLILYSLYLAMFMYGIIYAGNCNEYDSSTTPERETSFSRTEQSSFQQAPMLMSTVIQMDGPFNNVTKGWCCMDFIDRAHICQPNHVMLSAQCKFVALYLI